MPKGGRRMNLNLAGGILKDNEGRILLLHRNTSKLKQWELPGGKIEYNEDPSEAAVRELEEELGVGVSIIGYVGNKEFVENGYVMNYHWFECMIIKGIPKLMEDKFDILKFWNVSELNDIYEELSPNMKNLLPLLNK